MSVEAPFSQSSRQVCLARTGLFRALQDGGCSEPTGVLEAIEALIDAKRAEELDAATLFADRRNSEKVPPSEAPYVPARIRQEREETSSGAYVPRSARAQGLERMLADPYSRALQPHGNEGAQTPGIDEDADSETVTATIGVKSYPVTITPMDRRAAELGNPEAREFVAFADDSESS